MNILKGIPISEGIGIGKSVIIKEHKFDLHKKQAVCIKEIERFRDSVKKLNDELESKILNAQSERAAVLEAHQLMLNDDIILSEVEDVINKEKCNAEYAVEICFEKFAKTFEIMEDELLSARSNDLRDLKISLLHILEGVLKTDIKALPKNSIIVCEELLPSMAMEINAKNIKGVLLKTVGKTSHTAIILRSLRIPCVSGIDGIKDDEELIIDGQNGEIIIDPDAENIQKYKKIQEEIKREKSVLEHFRGRQSLTKDNIKIQLCANVSMDSDITDAVSNDAQAIGLFRTEFFYMNKNSLPTEDEQFELYKKAASIFEEKGVIIRTLDIGGDKEIPYLGLKKEENPFLGWRAIRYCLSNEDIFITQIKAILRASNYGKIKIMLPMIISLDEIHKSKKLIDKAKKELSDNNIPFDKNIQLGIMIETPSAVFMADHLAEEVDFFSIGTNDLTQYISCVDRGNEKIAHLYSSFNPAVLKAIYIIGKAAKKYGIMCGVCGEAAGNPILTKFLIGCGINELSMSSNKILKIKKIVSETSFKEANKAVEQHINKLKNEEEALKFFGFL